LVCAEFLKRDRDRAFRAGAEYGRGSVLGACGRICIGSITGEGFWRAQGEVSVCRGIAPWSARIEAGKSLRRYLVFFWKAVVEGVGMFSGGDLDRHFSGKAGKLAGARVGDDDNVQFRSATGERGEMLEGETAGSWTCWSFQSSDDALDGNIACRAFYIGGGGEHLAFAGGFEITVERFLDCHATESGIEFVVLRSEFDVEWSGGAARHSGSLLS